MNLGSQITSIIRIAIAAAVGTGVNLAVSKWGIDMDGETITAAVTGAFIGAYYAIARAIETRWPASRFLGLLNPEAPQV